ncbi:hypothetical protein C8F01DRAFT_1341866 [Mycena amicta]|nr:hypothetical protein C8F01DRAFT_1341866 [Mycena amicta]
MSGISASLIKPLVCQSARWRKLTLCASGDSDDMDTFFSLLQPVKGHLGKLEKFHCQFSSPLRNPVDMFLHVPNLLRLNFMVQHNHLRLSWRQVVRCYMEGPLREHLESLGGAHNLVDLRLNVDNAGLNAGSIIMITLPSLRRLYILGTWGLSHLTTPNLERLNISSAQGFELVPPFVQRSNCQLSLLGLWEENDSEIPMPELTDVLRCVPSLSILLITARVRDYGGTRYQGDCPRVHDLPALFSALTLNGSRSDLLPRLSTLSFGLEQNPFSDTFLTMVRSRLLAHNPHRLARLVIEDTSAPFLDEQVSYELTSQGLHIEWMDYRGLWQAEESYFPC